MKLYPKLEYSTENYGSSLYYEETPQNCENCKPIVNYDLIYFSFVKAYALYDMLQTETDRKMLFQDKSHMGLIVLLSI